MAVKRPGFKGPGHAESMHLRYAPLIHTSLSIQPNLCVYVYKYVLKSHRWIGKAAKLPDLLAGQAVSICKSWVCLEYNFLLLIQFLCRDDRLSRTQN